MGGGDGHTNKPAITIAMTIKKYLAFYAAIGLALGALCALVLLSPNPVAGAGGGRSQPSCITTTSSFALVGNQVSRTLLAANSNRAWARLTQARDAGGSATSTVFLSTDEGAAAVLNAGLNLSTSTPTLETGKETANVYTGEITGITDVGSTTVYVTECVYQ